MNSTILNRDFKHPTDGWYHIEPKGEHPNKASGVVQVIDSEAIASIVNRFNAEADAAPNFPGMLVDHEHFKHDPEKESLAYGWLTRLEGRTDGVYGQIRWTNTGKAAVDGGDYRFFSTEYAPTEAKILNSAKPVRLRPLRLDGLTLTNDPNNRGGRPITNRQEDNGDAQERIPTRGGNKGFRHGVDAAAGRDKNKPTKNMKSIASRLGLSADASEEAVLAELNKVMNRAEELGKQITPLMNRVTDLEKVNKDLIGEQVIILLDTHGVKDEAVLNRLKPVLLGMKDHAERVSFLNEVVAKPANAAGTKTDGKVLNRGDAKQPGQAAGGKTDDAAMADKITNRAKDLMATGNRSWDACWNQARNEVVK